jgi:hypothetical protein
MRKEKNVQAASVLATATATALNKMELGSSADAIAHHHRKRQ